MRHSATSVRPLLDLDHLASGTTSGVTAAGEIDLSVAADFEAAIHAAIDASPETVVVDLAGVRFIDSTGIHALLRAHRHAARRGVRLAIVPAHDDAQQAFRLCGVEDVLPFV